ncbi:nitrate/nitrite transporter NrtS [Microcystis aeruginosa]|uniref:Uncharacterized protein n=1 Tax=Microcystis aeruginosa NIES-44 TaxID=449439 RepID=A0A0A1VTF5_MICAE|nr:nitrate/nitrite transporter NrtS [Microcystis aeruginosa]GAL92753.1 hypothetical protein N44_01311 [Microcystis aeruginosa NIES-44]
MKGIIGYFRALLSPQFAPTGIKVAVIVGTILLTINHGYAIMLGRMTGDRWLAALLTYLVPYLVNVHGQYSSYHRQQWPKKSPK